jgi:hypothetical protein
MSWVRDAIGRFAGSGGGGGGRGRSSKGAKSAKGKPTKTKKAPAKAKKTDGIVFGKPSKAYLKRNPQPGTPAFERKLKREMTKRHGKDWDKTWF